MNTHGLTRHYDKLTAWERLPPLLAALNRGDDAEAERLARSAPTRPAGVPHYYGLWEGLALLRVVYQMQQLERLCAIVAAAGLMASGETAEGESRLKWLLPALRFVVDADAWKLFCAELQIDPDALLRHLPGCKLEQGMEAVARRIAAEAADR
jgi:hypothetical protein